MSNYSERYKIPALSEIEIETEAVVNEFISIISGLANEAKDENRSYTCDDVADILDTFVSSRLDQGLLADVLTLFADTLRDAQHSIHRSIEQQLATTITSNIDGQKQIILTKIKDESQLYTWIKTTSI